MHWRIDKDGKATKHGEFGTRAHTIEQLHRNLFKCLIFMYLQYIHVYRLYKAWGKNYIWYSSWKIEKNSIDMPTYVTI